MVRNIARANTLGSRDGAKSLTLGGGNANLESPPIPERFARLAQSLRAPLESSSIVPERSNYITRAGFRALRSELDWLWKDERPRVTEAVATAAALGDRSENADYIYGKKRLREIDRRIRFLTKRIDDLTVVDAGPRKEADRVYFGAWVELEDEDGETARYRLVGPDEFDAKAGLISVDSPVGKALMGQRLDSEVTVRRPKGETVYTILSIDYSEDTSEDLEEGES
jgi:transcription elongation factor GreB